jgi:hypothetical protein
LEVIVKAWVVHEAATTITAINWIFVSIAFILIMENLTRRIQKLFFD